MAPNTDSTFLQPHPTPTKPPKLSLEPLHRTISDISFELIAQETLTENERVQSPPLPPIPEIENAKCECCGMCEECTPQYAKKVRDKYHGRMVCGLCSEAVKEEMTKNGGKGEEEALHAHVSACSRFNRVGRAYPVLCQAQAMRELLRKSRAKSLSPRDHKNATKKGGIVRSSSCIPAITKEMSGRNTT